MNRIYVLLGWAQAGGAAGSVLTLLKTESVQLTLIVAVGAIIVGLVRWSLGQLIKIAGDKIDSWDASIKELDTKMDSLKGLVDRAGTRLDEHSGRIKAVEDRSMAVLVDALGRLVDRAARDKERT